MNGIINFYEMSQNIVGTVPPQYEIIYFIVTVALVFCAILIIMSPLLLFKAIGGR